MLALIDTLRLTIDLRVEVVGLELLTLIKRVEVRGVLVDRLGPLLVQTAPNRDIFVVHRVSS